MKTCFSIIAFLILAVPTLKAQIGYTVPTAIIIENSEYQAPVYNAEVDIIMIEDFGNSRRPVSTRIGIFKSNKEGTITVSLLPNKSYTVTTSCPGFYTQISKISTKNFSRTRENRKGISLRPRNVLAIKGNVLTQNNIQMIGQVSITNTTTKHTVTNPISPDGAYFVKALQGADYDMRVVVDGVLDTIVTLTEVDLQGSTVTDPYILDFTPNAPRPNYHKGDTLRLENMLFVGRTIKLQETVWVDTLSSILKRNPAVKMKINVYTDSRRSDRINYILAKKRVEELTIELNLRRVPSRQYIFEAKGEDNILNHCVDGTDCTKEEHEVNNRVELIIAGGKFLWNPDGG